MAEPQILRIPRSDSDDGFVLVRAAQRPKSSDLDLRLHATEGEAVYKGSVRASGLDQLRAKSNRSTEEEWSAILAYAFHQEPHIPDSNWIKGLKVTASIVSSGDDDEDSQKLGALELRQCEDEISLFDWCGTAVSSATSLQDDLQVLQDKAASLEDMNRKLKHQLDELIEAKTNHDKEMLAKFAQVLNEKKLKIRNQQRLLSTLNVSPGKADEKQVEIKKEEPNESPEPKPISKPRSSKRKIRADSSDDDGFDKMSVDHPHDSDASTQSESGRDTPQPLEEEEVETASEDET
ncbi:proteasome regulatory particle subunit [Ascosphaera pollenicola]|nr:proteasome regulatory particle subunit [Ascosphaera pollenicola]